MPSEILTTIYSQHTAHLQRVGATLGNEVTPYLEKIDEEIARIFRRYAGRGITAANRAAIIEQINTVTKEQLQAYVRHLKTEHRQIGADEAKFAAASIKTAVEGEINPIVPAAAAVNARAIGSVIQLGENAFTSYTSLMTNYWRKWADEIDGAVIAGFSTGQTIDEIADNIQKSIGLTRSDTSPNVLNRAKRSARQLAITGTNHYGNQARMAFAEENPDDVQGYRFIAVLDSRTSKYCRPLDQKVFKKDDPRLSRVTPPRHPNCRSSLVYEVSDKYKLDTKDTKRASNFAGDPKQVTSDGIYYEKMSRLTASEQDEILGATMGKAFRKLDNPEQFAKLTVDSLFNPLTIDEMKKRDNALSRILNNL